MKTGEKVKKLREIMKIGQSELSRLLEVSQPTVWFWEKFNRTISHSMIMRLQKLSMKHHANIKFITEDEEE